MGSGPGQHLDRYHRQMLLPGIGEGGQRGLLASSALIVGCGALGCVAADLLTRAGVGHLRLVDRDIVELTNLQRQTLYDERDVAEELPKAEAAARRLRAINTQVRIEPVVTDVNSRSIVPLLRDVNVVIDATDNFQTRYLLNDACVQAGLPLVYGGVVGTTGMSMTIIPKTTPCLRCVFPEPPPPGSAPTCDTVGVLGPMVGVIASTQAAEAIKVLLHRLDLVSHVLTQIDIWNNTRTSIDLRPVDWTTCICCARRRFEFLEGERADADTPKLCGINAVQVLPIHYGSTDLDFRVIAGRLDSHGRFAATEHFLRGRFERERDRATGAPIEMTLFRDGRAIVKGTTDPAFARSVYAKFIGA